MKKAIYIITFSLIFLLTGCSATYELKIMDENIEENFELIETNTSLFDAKLEDGTTMKSSLFQLTKEDVFVENSAIIDMIDEENKIGITYKKDFQLFNFSNSSIVNQCFDNPKIEQTDELIIIDINENFNCFDYYQYLDEVKINVTTNHVVEENNADKVSKNTYTWTLTRDNYYGKTITLKLKKDEYVYEHTNILLIALVITGIIITAIVGFVIIKLKNRENVNKF